MNDYGDMLAMVAENVKLRQDVLHLAVEIDRLRDEARWIPVGEHPTDSDALVVLRVPEIPESLVDIAYQADGVWYYRIGGLVEEDGTTVTHWRPLPAPPEVQS